MILILLVIAFSIDTNVIAGLTNVPKKNEISSIIVLNACSQDPPCFVSCNIDFGDVKLYRSSILDPAEKSYFTSANTTNGLNVTIFKHINVQDPGTVIFSKKLGDDEDTCFVVRGNYSTPKISTCLNDGLQPVSVRIKNVSQPTFLVKVRFYERNLLTEEYDLYGFQERTTGFTLSDGSTGDVSVTIMKRDPNLEKIEYTNVREGIKIGLGQFCLEIQGNFTHPVVKDVICTKLIKN